MRCGRQIITRLILASTVSLAAFHLPGAALAQQPEATVQLDTVVVEGQGGPAAPVNGYVATRSATGSKSDTPIAAIPQSVSVVGREEIDDRKALKVDEALRYTSGVTAQPFGPDPDTDWFFIRGFQATQTGVFLDGMPLYAYGFGGFQIDPFLLERVEVLKGPASVLYGGANPGGIVSLVGKRPNFKNFGFAEVGINNSGNAYVAIDMGLTDKQGIWSTRLTGRLAGGDQYTDVSKDFRGVILPQITYQPSGATRFTAYAMYEALDQVRAGGGFLPYVGTVVDAPFGKIARKAFLGEPSIDNQDRTQALVGYEFQHQFDNGWSFSQNARYGHMTGSQIGPYGYGYSAADSPFGNRYLPVGPDYQLYRIGFQERTRVETFTIDNRLERKFATGFLDHALMLGVDYKYFNIDHVQASGGATTISVTNPVYGAPQGSTFTYLDQNLKQHQLGFYLQDQIRFGGGWLLTLNGRYDYVDKKSVSPASLAFSPSFEKTEAAWSGRAGLAYEFANGLTPYVSAATFFNPVFDANGTNVPGVFVPFQPEKGYQLEAGVKYKPAFMDALITASVFHLVKQNVLTPAPTSYNAFAQQQLGEVTSTGVELEAKANLTENLKLIAAFTAFDLETTKDTRPAYVGKTPQIVPEVTASGWVDYSFNEGMLKGVSLGAGVRYVGSSWADNENTLKVPGATLVDAALRYKIGDWGLALNVTNLFDKVYVKSCQGYSSCAYGDARTVTVSANYKW
ncbi:TonB-dependent siderophore receptor [Bosea sp. BE125]|uniref:TonB-dependent siderophore receptor n=1 Tax=Bosea sp. BE125 TaxID=2817909 RepID=UPI00286C3E1A|nr:TonB-dependent siderophore receptor [Bosea sp. BE125]